MERKSYVYFQEDGRKRKIVIKICFFLVKGVLKGNGRAKPRDCAPIYRTGSEL